MALPFHHYCPGRSEKPGEQSLNWEILLCSIIIHRWERGSGRILKSDVLKMAKSCTLCHVWAFAWVYICYNIFPFFYLRALFSWRPLFAPFARPLGDATLPLPSVFKSLLMGSEPRSQVLNSRIIFVAI
jgi:hypothetical protein